MKTGEAYWGSRQQRALDLTVVRFAKPALSAAKFALAQTLPAGEDPIFRQKRVGRDARLFEIEKLHTLDANEQPFNPLAARYRKLGIDELAQIANITRGEMSVCGWRPIVKDSVTNDYSYEEMMDNLTPRLQKRWDFVSVNTRPGIVSSYGLYLHAHDDRYDLGEYERRVEMNYKDALEASLASDLALLGKMVTLASQILHDSAPGDPYLAPRL